MSIERDYQPREKIIRSITLTDGSQVSVVAEERTSAVIALLAQVMQLHDQTRYHRQIIVQGDDRPIRGNDVCRWLILPSTADNSSVCLLNPADNRDMLTLQLIKLSLGIALDVQFRGGVLLHGALIAREEQGVILAGPGGVGKTTAVQRLMPPWKGLCDDHTLIVRDHQGMYWAHPWPTWSRFMFGGSGGTWNVQQAVQLKGIFFLKQAKEDRVKPVRNGQAGCLLVQSAEQAWWAMSRSIHADGIRQIRLQRFENICVLAQVMPCYVLHLTGTGAFWHHIENVMIS